MAAMKLTYTSKPNGVVKEKDVAQVAKEILRIERRHGTTSPSVVVDEARSESSPLHSYFTWDDTEAAEAHRRWQARVLVASVRVIYQGRSGPSTVRAFVNVVTTNGKDTSQGYMNITKVMSNAQLREQMLEAALNEITQWRERYNHLTELVSIFDAIDEITH